MCISPVSIINPSKYLRINSSDRFLIQVPCGHCFQCQSLNASQWSYRLLYEAIDTFENNGFVLFDTLTYNDSFLPHISDFIDIPIVNDIDFSCFNYSHLRLFVAKLRQRCKRKFNANFKYFIASEYGTSEYYVLYGSIRRATHRPHYHVLFFVVGDISPIEFSKLVSDCWDYGLTDGGENSDYDSIMYHVFRQLDSHSLRQIRYVSKYIQKNSLFQSTINFRLDLIMDFVCEKFESLGIENWRDSSHYWRLRERFARCINQFHRQSTNLGIRALVDLDINQLMIDGYVTMPDTGSVVKRVPLSLYYKRKLFYNLVNIDGSNIWIPNELGYKYLEIQRSRSLIQLRDKLISYNYTFNDNIDVDKIADYCINTRGRFSGNVESRDLRYLKPTHYVYVNRYDKEFFGETFVSYKFYGNSTVGYRSRCASQNGIPISVFLKRYVIRNSQYDELLEKVFNKLSVVGQHRQDFQDYKVELSNKLHYLFS